MTQEAAYEWEDEYGLMADIVGAEEYEYHTNNQIY